MSDEELNSILQQAYEAGYEAGKLYGDRNSYREGQKDVLAKIAELLGVEVKIIC